MATDDELATTQSLSTRAASKATLTVPAPGVLANDTDGDALTAGLVTGPTNGVLALAADGSLTYTPQRRACRNRHVHVSGQRTAAPTPTSRR